MSMPVLRLSSVAAGLVAGLLATSTLTACSDGGPKTCAEGDDCSGEGNGLDGADGGKPPAKDGSVRDAKANTADAGVDGGASNKNVPCDVAAIVKDKCSLCHGATPAFNAPMSLVTLADFNAKAPDGRTFYENVHDRINSTTPSTKMPPTTNDQLSADELATMNTWLEGNAPGSTEKCSTTGGGNTDAGTGGGQLDDGGYVEPTDDELTCYKILAHNGDFKTPFKVGVAQDAYYTFTWASPWKDTSYGIVIRPVIDNTQALHHWLLFQDLVPGIPGGAVAEIGAHPSGQLLAAWAPGADPMDFRQLGQGVGLELPGGSNTYTLELHYNSKDANAADASGVEVCVAAKAPPNVAAYSWLGKDNLGLPAAEWTGTCTPFAQTAPIHIVSFMPHMHLTGIHMKGTVNRANGTKEVVHDQDFDFNYQKSYPVNVVLMPGDSLTTVCDYNTPGVFGQPTNKEMCYLFSMAYPKGALSSPDVWGGIAHGASSCLGN